MSTRTESNKNTAATLILVVGGSASGKTSVVEELQRLLSPHGGCVVFSTDSFYKTGSAATNFDVPSSTDEPLIIEVVRRAMEGQELELPVYSFESHSRVGVERRPAECHRFVILEGIFAMTAAVLEGLADYSPVTVFVDGGGYEELLRRRTARDVAERGRTPESVLEAFNTRVWPAYLEFVAPLLQRCSRVIANTRDKDSLRNTVRQFALELAPETVHPLGLDH